MVLASVIAGASGGALANVALSPLGGGAGLLQSYWYGAGLILGERMMYTFHWEKINTRIKKGEDFLSVLESEMNPAITAIANYSLTVMQKTGAIYMQGGIDFMAKLIENMLKLLAGEKIDEHNCPAGTQWDGVRCRPTTVTPTPQPEPEPVFVPPPTDGVILPPVETAPTPTPTPDPAPSPTPKPLTNLEILQKAVGMMRTGFSYNIQKWSGYSISTPDSDRMDGYQWRRIVTANSNKANVISIMDSAYHPNLYVKFTLPWLNGEQNMFWVPRVAVGLPNK